MTPFEECTEPVRRGVEPLVYEKGRPGHRGMDLPPAGVDTPRRPGCCGAPAGGGGRRACLSCPSRKWYGITRSSPI